MKCSINYVVTVITCSFIFIFSEAAYAPRVPQKPSRGAAAAGCGTPQLEHGRVRTRQRARLVRFLCFSGFEIVGNKYATCNNGEWDVPMPVCVRAGCPSFRDIENGIQVPSHNGAYLSFYCGPRHKLAGSPVIYCDGVKWNSTRPVCIDTSLQPRLTCDFEQADLCGWKNDEFHDFDWRRFSKKTPSSFMNTGPSHDHTMGPAGRGHYLYVESTGRVPEDKARLMSPIYDSELVQGGCFSFYYHMFGKTTGSLRVYVKPITLDLAPIIADADSPYKKFEKSGNQGNMWYREIFDLPEMQENFQIVIEGVRGTSFTSDIAIDDVALLTNGEQCRTERNSMQPVVPPPAIPLDSCSGRCGSAQIFSELGDMFECSCEDSCLDEESCCADYRDLCDGFISSTLLNEVTIDDTPPQSEPKPQTMKLVASTQVTFQGSTVSKHASTTASTSTTTTTTTTLAPKTTSLKTTTTIKTTIAAKTTTPIMLLTTTKKPASLKPPRPEKTTTSIPSTTSKLITTTIAPTKRILPPKPKIRTTTPGPTNATVVLEITNSSKRSEISKVTVKTKTFTPIPTVRPTTKKVTKRAEMTTKVTPRVTPALPLAKTTKYDGVQAISRTFEDHRSYNEHVDSTQQGKMKKEAFKVSVKSPGSRSSMLAAVLVSAAVVTCLLGALLALAVRGGWLRTGIERMRARGHERTDDVRYLTADDHLNFE